MYIISEVFPQHGGDMDMAEQMILQSKMGGANSVKIQLYNGTQFGVERDYLACSFDDFVRLKEYAESINIPLFGTPFNEESFEWCKELKMPIMKVAARMHEQMPDLVDKIMEMNVPTFVSIPHDTDPNTIKQYDHATYLYCVVKYPTRVDEIALPDFSNSIFEGISDHTLGNAGALYASAHGAKYLEKHFTLRNSFQFATEQAHLGAMTLEDLRMIKNTAKEFETIRQVLL